MAYYRVCGYRSHTRNWFQYNDKTLCEIIFNSLNNEKPGSRDIGVELILGVLPNGASYILATPAQMDKISQYSRRKATGRADLAADYASLSPIYFRTLEDLERKMKSYQQKPRKKGKKFDNAFGGERIDNSQANKPFFLGNSTNLSRSNFEHQRVLWKAIQGSIDFTKFCMPEMHWLSSTSFVGLCMNTWNFGPIPERKQNPKILDIGWTRVPCLSLRDEYKEELFSSIHIVVQEHIAFSNSGTKRVSFKYGNTETCKSEQLGAKLKEYLGNLPNDRVLLLVHDKERTVNALTNLGLQASGWITGISKLIRMDQKQPLKEKKYVGWGYDHQTWNRWNGREESESYYKRDLRERSRSPRHRDDSCTSYPRRYRSPPRSAVEPDSEPEEGEECEEDEEDEHISNEPTFYVIDIQDLFIALSPDPNSQGTPLHTIARKLGIPANPSTVCAGNDCHLLVRAWMSMASGSAVDEQRADRWSCSPDEFLALETVDSNETAEQEVDINDIDPSTVQSSMRPIREPGRYVPEGDDDSDDEDWY